MYLNKRDQEVPGSAILPVTSASTCLSSHRSWSDAAKLRHKYQDAASSCCDTMRQDHDRGVVAASSWPKFGRWGAT